MTTYFFEDPTIDLDMIINNKFLKKFSEEELSDMLQVTSRKLESVDNWEPEKLQEVLNGLLIELDKKPAELFSIIRIALSFAPFSPALPLTMDVLGKNIVLARLHKVVTALEAPNNN